MILWIFVPSVQTQLKSCSLLTNLLDDDLDTTMRQEFTLKGPLDITREAVYEFPLLSDAAVYHFKGEFFDDEGNLLTRLQGKAQEKQEAKETFEAGKANRRTVQ